MDPSLHLSSSPSSGEELTLTILVIISSGLSVIGACFILFGVLFPQPKSVSRRIVFMMAAADLMVSLPALGGCLYRVSKYPQPNPMAQVGKVFCKVQAYCVAVGALLSFIWTMGLSQHIFLLVKYGLNAAKKGYVALFVLSIVPFALNVYTYQADILGNINSTNVSSQNWCYIEEASCMWMVWDGKLLEVISYIVIIVFNVLAYRHMRLSSGDESFNRTARARKLILIPAVFVLTRLPGTILTVWVVANKCNPGHSPVIYLLRYPQAVLDTAQGWINWILFWWTIDGGRQFVLIIKRCCGMCTLEEEQMISEIEDEDSGEDMSPCQVESEYRRA